MKHVEIVAAATVLSQQAGLAHGVAYRMIADAIEETKGKLEPEQNPPIFYDTLEQANIARQLEWKNSDKLDLSYFGNAAAGEMGEACNVVKKLERERLGLEGSRATIADLATELADVVIYVSLLAIKSGIDLDRAIFEKFNATSEKLGFRTRLHG
jgi:NTP pyrophosphatase (non-canonical NTP hydrolase)